MKCLQECLSIFPFTLYTWTGQGHEMNIFKTYKIKKYILYCTCATNFEATWLKRKISMFLLLLWKHLLKVILKIVPKAFPGFILSHWSIFPSVHVIAGFQPQAAIWRPEQEPEKYFITASKIFIFNVKTAKNCENLSAHIKITDFIFRTVIKY